MTTLTPTTIPTVVARTGTNEEPHDQVDLVNEFEPTFAALTVSDVAAIVLGMVLVAAVLLAAWLVIA